jgi:hypothetical protein
MSVLRNNNFNLEVAKGKISGHKSVNKFGAAIDGLQTTQTDIWDRADAAATQPIWLPPTAARIHAIESTLVVDSDVGGLNPQSTGARTIRVYGLTSWSTKEVSEVVILDGDDPVNTANSYVIIHRMKVLTAGSGHINAGDITATAAAPDSTVTAQISAGQGQTLMAIYGVPSLQIAYMTQLYINMHQNSNPGTVAEADFHMEVNETPDVDTLLYLTKHTGGVITSGTTHIVHPFNPPKTISGPAIIKIHGTASSNDLYTSAGFDLILVDN